jgi:glycosyltransferase involved in cell wall biosynthesis
VAGSPDASILITTRNRIGELRRALDSALLQTSVTEVIVIDDGSDDGTAQAVAGEFPMVRLLRSPVSQGLIVQRNAGIWLARAPFVVSIDDDAVFSKPSIVEQTLHDFDHPRVGAVAIPLVDVAKSAVVQQRPPTAEHIHVASVFRGGAFAVRRDVFLTLGGFRTVIFHQGEERDFCLRMLAAGFVTRLGRAEPIYHFESPARDLRRMDLYGRRNDILCSWHNDPFPYAPLRMAELTVKGIGWGLKVGRPLRMLKGLAMGYRMCWAERRRRAPVLPATARLHRRLRRRGPLLLEEIEQELGGRPTRVHTEPRLGAGTAAHLESV